MTKADIAYFEKARCAAMMSDFQKTHIGCIAVYKKKVIGIGYNCNKTSPMQKYYNRYRLKTKNNNAMLPKLHAEISCINSVRSMDIDFTKVKLYIYRIRSSQAYGISRPCQSCMEAIRDIGIRDIYYTTNDGYAHENITKMGKDEHLHGMRYMWKDWRA